MKNKIYGVGINDLKGQGLSKTRAYIDWTHILERCYSEKYHEKKATYIDCEISEEWKYFSNFKKWHDDSFPFWLRHEINIDKDLLGNGTKIYSAETCCFIPARLNQIIKGTNANNETGFNGITKNKNSWGWNVNTTGWNDKKATNKKFLRRDAAVNYYLQKRQELKKEIEKYLLNSDIARKFLIMLAVDKFFIDEVISCRNTLIEMKHKVLK